MGTCLNGFSLEYEPLGSELERSGERVDQEAKAMSNQVLRNLEPQMDRLHEGVQLCEFMRRTLCNLIGQLVHLNSISQKLHSKRAELLQKECDGVEQSIVATLNEEILQVSTFSLNCRWRMREGRSRSTWIG
jgi:hypothetical protein